MANVLLLDAAERSAYFARILLRGMGHRGTISTDHAGAVAKVESGLIDIVYVDIDPRDPVSDLRFIQHVDVVLPGAPIVRVADLDLDLPEQPIAADLRRPMSLDRLTAAFSRATAILAELSLERRRHRRKDVDLGVELGLVGHHQTGRVVNLSLGGVLVEVPSFGLVDGAAGGCDVDFRLGRLRVHLRARVAYATRIGSGRPCLGLQFRDLDGEQRRGLRTLLHAA